MLSSVMSPTAKTTVSLYLELLLAIQSHSKVLRSPSDRYFQFVHHPLLSHTNASFSTLACHVQHRLQLGVFRRTAIQGQFRLEWLQSTYRNFEWGYSVDFFRIEDYEPGKLLCFGILVLRISFLNFFFFIPGKKINTFDTTPKQFVSLVPNFWCWPMWKSAMFMHHDLAVLEQVL